MSNTVTNTGKMLYWKARAEAAETALAKSEESRQRLFSALQELKMQEPVAEWSTKTDGFRFLHPTQKPTESIPLYAAPVAEKVCTTPAEARIEELEMVTYPPIEVKAGHNCIICPVAKGTDTATYILGGFVIHPLMDFIEYPWGIELLFAPSKDTQLHVTIASAVD